MPISRNPTSLLVTGGCGFIGSAFIRYLFRQSDFSGRIVNLDLLTYAANPANVTAHVDGSRYQMVRGDICDAELVGKLCKDNAVDAIIHFAAESHVDRSILGPDVFIQTNIIGTHRLLEVVRSNPTIHFHHVSTDEVYGSLGTTGLFTEKTPYHPNSPYSASKASSDHLVNAYVHTYGIQATLSNCSNNYGPFQFPEKLLPLMLLNMLDGQSLPVYGDGSNVRDWLYVDDHVDAIWTIVRRGATGETYNIGGEAEWSNLALLHLLIDTVAEQTGRDAASLRALITFVRDRPGHDLRYAIDCTKIKRELGWRQHHDIRSGLRETVRWYLANSDWVQNIRSGDYRKWLERNYAQR
jgi:dTDP-glucose 4,6-dehydratase